ncbi:MAG: hypothetical protein AB7N54_15715 [Alphaproteobacteria bacterium]
MAAGSISGTVGGSDGGIRGGRGRKRLVLFGGAGLLLLAGLGAAGAAFGLKEEVVGPAPPPPLTVEALPVAEPVFVRMDPLHVAFYVGNGDRRRLAISARLEVDGARHDDSFVYAFMPRLREAFMRALTDRPIPGADDGKPDLVHIKNRMRAAAIDVVGAGVVADVLVQELHYFND